MALRSTPAPRLIHDAVLTTGDEEVRRITIEILNLLFGGFPPNAVSVRLWDGTLWPARPAEVAPEPGVTLILAHPGALRSMLLPPTARALGEAYMRDDFDIEGDLEAAFTLGDAIMSVVNSPRTVQTLAQLVRRLPRAKPTTTIRGAATRIGRHSRRRDRAAVQHHYDRSNDFYRLWLDRRMAYSCAYFDSEADDLDAAQEAKLDLICRKLRLQPGERLLDIGCGWGSLLLFAAERYGVEATGVTLAREQAALLERRITAAGLTGRARVVLTDYRDLPANQPFDKIASVEMFEQVGGARLPEYFGTLYRLLKAGGLFLNQGIAQQHLFPSAARRIVDRAINDGTSFIKHHIFPDGELVSLSAALDAAERAGWEVAGVEGLGAHYARTLRLWGQQLKAHQEEAERAVGRQTYRAWELYLAGSAYYFACGQLGVFQALFSKRAARAQ